MLYKDNYYIVVGHGSATRTMYNGNIQDNGEVHVCVLASKYHNLTSHHNNDFIYSIEIPVREAVEVTDKDTLMILDVLYG